METRISQSRWLWLLIVLWGIWCVGSFESHMTSTFLLPYHYVSGGYRGTDWVVRGSLRDIFPMYGYAQTHRQMVHALAEGAEEISISVEEETNPVSLEELMLQENQVVLQPTPQPTVFQENTFSPREKQTNVDISTMENYEDLVAAFYTIDANTSVGSDRLNVYRLMEQDMTVDKNVKVPQILIFHTHSMEGYADSGEGEENTGIMGVGEKLADILRERYGYNVLHHEGRYDVDGRNDAYTNALPEIAGILEDNPSIEVVIDLHRDEMPEGKRLVMDVDGKPTARFMFFNGLSRTKKTGDIDYLYNKNLDKNLAFSFQMQLKAAEYYPGLTRKIYLKGYRYNMHLAPKYLLIELGAQNNTLEEAMNACEPLAHVLDMVLSGT
ncbi:MAG: stage II sporulation protein P [Lachnospiraceae bacterium]|nr:stage II sporulation protein P [Lachnospiraceae bacterium]